MFIVFRFVFFRTQGMIVVVGVVVVFLAAAVVAVVNWSPILDGNNFNFI